MNYLTISKLAWAFFSVLMLTGCEKGHGDMLVIYSAKIEIEEGFEGKFFEKLKAISTNNNYTYRKKEFPTLRNHLIYTAEMSIKHISVFVTNLEKKRTFSLVLNKQGKDREIDSFAEGIISILESELKKELYLNYVVEELKIYNIR